MHKGAIYVFEQDYIIRLIKNRVFKDITCYLCKDLSTISKEIRSRCLSVFYPDRGLFLNARNFCIHRFRCQKKNVICFCN